MKGVSGLLPVFIPTLPPQTNTLKHKDCWVFGFSILSKDTSSELGEPDGKFLQFTGLISFIQLVKSHRKFLERGGPIKIIWKVITTFCLSYSKQTSLIFRCQFRQIATARGLVLMGGATLDTCHRPLAVRDARQYLTKLLPKPAGGRVQTSSEKNLWTSRLFFH